ncbi:MAG: rhomboid family intramembrane serine protease [Candidatus Nanoarchaeia archaeon]
MSTNSSNNNDSLSQEPSESIISMYEELYNQGRYVEAYDYLYSFSLKTHFPNLYFYLATCAYQLDNTPLAITHLKQELKYYNNLHALHFLERLEVRNSTPYLTFTLVIIISLIYYLFFFNYSQLDIFLYSLHIDSISLTSAITSLFFHTSHIHFLANIFLFLLLGSFIEQFISKIHYISIFLISGVLSNIIQVIVSSEFQAVFGMSGALFGLFAIIVLRAPLLYIPIFMLKVPMLVFLLLSYIISLIFVYYDNTFIAHYSHLFGFLIGLGIGVLFNIHFRERFYALLLFTFGVLLTTSSILPNSAFIFHWTLDLAVAIFLMSLSYAYLYQIKKHADIPLQGGEE